MASPQKENGFTPIANELMEALCRTRIPGETRQVLDTILRKTYGWNKKQDAISLSQFTQATGLSKVHTRQAIVKLISMNIITEKGKGVTEKGNEIGQVYEFNKDYDNWKPLPKKVTLPKKVRAFTEKGKNPLPNSVPTKEIYKDTITKDNIFVHFWNAYPKKKDKGHALKAWQKITDQKATLELILSALEWQKISYDWTKEGGQYIPLPSTYLNGRRWEDEPDKWTAPRHSGIQEWLNKKGETDEPEER